MAKPKQPDCKCGSTPTLEHKDCVWIYGVQLKCKCGKHGAVILYTKPEDRPRCEQIAVDGWNLSE